MGKIVMPKNSALLNEIESVLEIYYEADGWLGNDVYKERLKEMIGDDQYSSSYTKKAQITSYFGFTEWEDINKPQSMRRITDSGKEMYQAIKSNDTAKIQSVLMNSLETVKFGRNNFGSPESDSDIEPPALFIRASMDLEYLTYKEFAYLLWKLEDIGGNYTDSLSELKQFRISDNLTLGEEANKYIDCKPIMILVRWGFLAEDGDTTGGKHIIVAPDVLRKYKTRLRNLKIYNVDMDYDDPIIDTDDRMSVDFDRVERVKGGMNTLLYGVPGSGKSWTIEKEYCDDESRMERLVFHPDYTYSDFIGQILPNVSDGIVSYKFTEGPFTSLLKKAYTQPERMFFLVIEEINRGNAPAIFGEVFQLLDRKDDGTSEYGITNVDIASIVYNNPNKKVRIPSNMSIIGTMNTSDQNVFTLDTAFQRRWNMRMIENTFVGHDYARTTILDTSVTWQRFCEVINNEIVTKNIRMTSSEDKRLGTYFVRAADLEYHEEAGNNDLSEKEQIQARLLNYRFAEKVLKYLWDDAFKFSREDIFKNTIYKSLEEVVNHFNSRSSAKATGNDRLDVFKEEIIDAFLTQDSIDSTVE
ncbi:AAA domain-containing protein [Streptococcus uberis]|uniref:McrB family protein n=1 Tax=Streptococcus uberis TaxID=1349 RepID=UPI0018E15EA5|nr:AAA family ATPase [Streptococcus uberis]MBI0906906.1 AAA domain-containing protein [Streptococcus uberis]MDD4632546.1 AAA family ATPase [Proteiniphilum sp.]